MFKLNHFCKSIFYPKKKLYKIYVKKDKSLEKSLHIPCQHFFFFWFGEYMLENIYIN